MIYKVLIPKLADYYPQERVLVCSYLAGALPLPPLCTLFLPGQSISPYLYVLLASVPGAVIPLSI